MTDDLARYRQLAQLLAKGQRSGWLSRGRALAEIRDDRLFLMSGATTFRKWCESTFSAKRLRAVLAEMRAAEVFDECITESLSPPPTLAIAASIGPIEDRLDICRSANQIATNRGAAIASINDYNQAIYEFLVPSTGIEGVAKAMRHGRLLLVYATRVNSVIKSIERHKRDEGFELISQHWRQIGAFLRRAWAALVCSSPWAVCPDCLASGGYCATCSQRGWLGKMEVRDVVRRGDTTKAQRSISRAMTQGSKAVESFPASFMFARKLGLQVCVRCGKPVRYGLTCRDCTEQSKVCLTKNQVQLWLGVCKQNITSDPDNALAHVEAVSAAVEEWTGQDLGFKGEEHIRKNHESKMEAKEAGGEDGTGNNLGGGTIAE